MSGSDLQRKLQDSVERVIKEIDESRMRSLQKNCYLKMAACFDQRGATSQSIQNCLQTQGALVQSAQNIIQNEMNMFQDRLQRCSLACQDEVRDKFGSEPDQVKAENHMIKCAGVCVDKHIAMLPQLKKKILTDMDKIAK